MMWDVGVGRMAQAIGRILLVLTCALMSCCSGDDNGRAVDTGAPSVDARFTSVEALSDWYGDVMADDPADFDRVIEAYYAENQVQEQLLRMLKHMAPIQKMRHIAKTRIGMPENQLARLSGRKFAMSIRQLNLKSQDEQRAQVEFIRSDGSRGILHLVKMGDRWWISGYTLERMPETKTVIDRLNHAEVVLEFNAYVMSRLVSDIQSGAVHDNDSLNEATTKHRRAFERDNPARYALLKDAYTKHEDFMNDRPLYD